MFTYLKKEERIWSNSKVAEPFASKKKKKKKREEKSSESVCYIVIYICTLSLCQTLD